MPVLYSTLDTFTPDKLFAGNDVPVLVKGVTLKGGQGVLRRGSVLGLIILGAVTIAATAGNAGDAAIASATLAANAQKGVYTIKCITAPSQAAENDAKFAVFAPDGSRLADAVQNVDYAGGHLVFKISNATAADSAVGDSYTITVAAGSEGAVLVDNSKLDGTGIADCILVTETDTGDASPDDDIYAEVYTSGHFNRQALVFGGNDNASDHEARLRELNIILSDNIAY